MIRKPGFEEASRMFPGWSPSIMKRMLETPEKWDDKDIANIKEYMRPLDELAQGHTKSSPDAL
jgi:hypothetical protein